MNSTLGVILAGGLARRLGGGDKALRVVGGRTVLGRVLDTMRPQVAGLLLNANGDPARFVAWGLPVVADAAPDRPGPLAGVLAGLDWAVAHGLDWVVTVPGDAPFLPANLVARLHQARQEAGAAYACAASGGWRHPVAALWPTAAREDLRAALADGLHEVKAFTARRTLAVAEWPVGDADPFFNVNTPEDLAEASRLARYMPR